MSNAAFASLIKDLERLIGAPIDVREGESLRFQFDGDLRVSLAPDQSGNVVIDADIGRSHPRDGQVDVARLLLQRNYASRAGDRLYAALDSQANIVLTQTVPIGELDANKLGDRLQALLDEAEALRRTVDGLSAAPASAAPATTSEEMLRTQTVFLRV